MEYQIVCPHCKKTIANDPIINDAARGAGSDSRSIICECGERITYWQITAQLRAQQTIGKRFQTWIRSFSGKQA